MVNTIVVFSRLQYHLIGLISCNFEIQITLWIVGSHYILLLVHTFKKNYLSDGLVGYPIRKFWLLQISFPPITLSWRVFLKLAKGVGIFPF